ncbi:MULTISPECIES: hypothetical protein [Nocardia]|uniref:hypothetical protein n=1 Tax=Nocardia TaxID=1817 RepID=UPI002457562F|nr:MULTISPECIES: hypothetical protein [Nocardia]
MTTDRDRPAADWRRRADEEATERAHHALRDRPDYRDRLEIARALERAAFSASAVGMQLGAWAARGDWATLTEEGRTRAGERALTDLDAALDQLAAVRERLATTLAQQKDDRPHPAGPDPDTTGADTPLS